MSDAPLKIPEGRLHLKVYAPYRVYFDDLADSVSAVNPTGPFDILPKHHNFLTLLNPGEIVIRSSGSDTKKIQISRGIMHVKANNVTVFLDV